MTKHADTPRKVTTFRIDQDLLDGLQAVWERDGVAVSEQVRRAIRAWLESKGIVEKSERKRVGPRKRS
jgi:metal-responsive CopG/Arc/MetJ family transcriptional regulator